MDIEKIAMAMAEEWFIKHRQIPLDWLRVFKEMEGREAENEVTRLVHQLQQRELTREDAALVGGILEDCNTAFMLQFLGMENGYTYQEAMDAYIGCRRAMERMADGLWEGHCVRWTKQAYERAQRDLAKLPKRQALEMARVG